MNALNGPVFDAKHAADLERQVQIILREIAYDFRDHVLGIEDAKMTVFVA